MATPRRSVRDLLGSTAEFNIIPDGADLLDTLVLRAEAEAQARGWGTERDADLRWFWLYDNGPLPNGMASMAMGLAQSSPALEGLHPVQLIDLLEQYTTRVDKALVGFVVVVEAWMLVYADGDEPNRARVWAAADRREVWRQPDRREVRTAWLQMLNGQTRSVIRVRGQDPQLLDWPLMPKDAEDVAGAMRRLAVTLRRRKYGRRG